jgi:SAM-dependent methyltransferase
MSEITHWDERYQKGEIPWDTGQPSSELLRVLVEEQIEPCPALELGCGTGTNAVWLAKQGFTVTAVDVSPRALAQARTRAEAAGVPLHLLAADLTAAPALGGPYRFFFDRGCYHAVRRVQLAGYLRALEAATRPGTLGLVLAGNAREPHEPGPPVVSAEEVRAELGRVFEIVRLREFHFDPAPGVPVRFLGWSCLLRRPGPGERTERVV